jgi:hypothetical protein
MGPRFFLLGPRIFSMGPRFFLLGSRIFPMGSGFFQLKNGTAQQSSAFSTELQIGASRREEGPSRPRRSLRQLQLSSLQTSFRAALPGDLKSRDTEDPLEAMQRFRENPGVLRSEPGGESRVM